MAGFSSICCVVNMGDASKILKFARKYGIKEGIVSIGRGTVPAPSRFWKFWGASEIRKEIVTMIAENKSAARAIKSISKYMMFDKPHHGIAFSYSVSEFISSGNKAAKKSKTREVKNNMYNVIYVIVDKGKAEDVVDAANKAGARGSTIVNARGSDFRKVFSLEIEPEKEEVFIVAKTKLKNNIVKSVRKHLQIDKPGNGIIFVLDVNEVYGLHDHKAD